jgi:uncharacterized protein YggE
MMMNIKIFNGLLAFAILVFTSSGSAHEGLGAEPMKDSVIAVTGQAGTSVAPDLVTVQFGVEVQGKTAAEALSANSGLMAEVVEAVRKTGIENREISTSQFNIHPVYEYHRETSGGIRNQVLIGYRVSNMLSIETGKLDMIAEIIDRAVDAGVNRIDQVAFSLSPPVRKRLQDEMIEAAVLDARAKADKALAPLGKAVTGVQQMVLSDFAPPSPLRADLQRMEMASAPPTQVFASEQDVRTTVNVTFLVGEN